MQLHQLVYSSVATEQFDDKKLAELLDRARRNNSAARVTGVLVYDNGRFIQVLEGEVDSINKLYGVIEHDVRHQSVQVIGRSPIASRSFPDWSMGYVRVEDGVPAIPGYLDVTSVSAVTTRLVHAAGKVKELLQTYLPQ